jgi:hypothetical protein
VRISGDFDGDSRPDLATYRASAGEWRIWTAASNFTAHTLVQYGAPGDVPVPADYDGDRRTDVAVYRPNTGNWHLKLSGSNERVVHWGGPTDTPLPLDHDGDGKADLAVFRNGGYDILLSSANYSSSVQVR